MGKAKFGIFGDGKEIAQIAMSKVFRNGDFRSGYYRDQTFMLAIGELTLEAYFAQLYAHTDITKDPASAGRQMNGHFATRMIDETGSLKDLTKEKNSSADISPTAGQMARLVGLAWASMLFRNNKGLKKYKHLSDSGNEVAFGTIGNASTSEGVFLEAINAAGVLQIPLVISIWDDNYGISVPQKYHTTKCSISKALAGFQRNKKEPGIEIFTVKGWDYPGLLKTYEEAATLAREQHIPVMIHVEEMTQPQGHSTSGSHERYKSKERLVWESEFDCIKKMREWIIDNGIAIESELDEIEKEAKTEAKKSRNNSWKKYLDEILEWQNEVLTFIEKAASESNQKDNLNGLKHELSSVINPVKADIIRTAKKTMRLLRFENLPVKKDLVKWIKQFEEKSFEDYSSHLYSETSKSALLVQRIAPEYIEDSKIVDGRQVLQACFDHALKRDPRVLAFGEDLGKIGDVNQAFAGLQDKYGELRVIDTGIREDTIIGQGIGTAMRGLRPIAEIQYLDYIYYALQTLSDDLATLQYRTKGGQKAPLIIRTRGHRLEGIWHSGSHMGVILHSLRGIYVLVPRNMTKAAAFYNTMLKSDDPALIIECLNGYRLKEKLPENIGKITEPLGVPEVIREGTDVTIVTYGSMCRIVQEAASQLQEVGISAEIIDVQTLIPFDRHHAIVESIKKTNRVVFADEDVPGGASAYMMQKVLEEQDAFIYLDSLPVSVTAADHRPAYGSDGDYFSKPNVEQVFDKVYELMSEADPEKYPGIY
ncbi:MAG: transketolase [Bacteroidetes bacterium]|nr:transketolase [Bacteroidota bacterium]